MKRTPFLFLLTFVLLALTILPAAKMEVSTSEPKLNPASAMVATAAPFVPPTVTLTSPFNNANFLAGATIRFSASATDSDGSVSKVEFYQGAVKLGTVTSSPYNYDWQNVPAGNYVLTAVATDNSSQTTTSTAINISVLPQARQYVTWSSITNGTDLGNGTVRKTSAGSWDFNAVAAQKALPGDSYFESTAASGASQSIQLDGSNGQTRYIVIGTGSWVGIYENGVEVASTCCRAPSETIPVHAVGDRYRFEISDGKLIYVKYRAGLRTVLFASSASLPAYPLTFSLNSSLQNAEWQKSVLAQLNRKVTWSNIVNGIDLGNGTVRKTSTGAWDHYAVVAQQALPGDSYFESTAASGANQSFAMDGSDGHGRYIVIGTGSWVGIYEDGVEVAATCCRAPSETIPVHAVGDRYRFEISNGKLIYVKYRAGVRTVLFTSNAALPGYPLTFSVHSSLQNAEWQNSVISQQTNNATWSSITNGIDAGNGTVRKTSAGAWDFAAGVRQQLVSGGGYFEGTASSYNQSMNLNASDGQYRYIVVGTGSWAGIYENGAEVAATCCRSPSETIAPHVPGDRYRLEISRGKLRYVRYRASVRSVMFTSNNALPPYPYVFTLAMSFQNSEWQNCVLRDNVPEHNDATFVSQTVPATMVPGQNYNVSVTMRNTGASTWTPDGDYQLGSENLSDNTRWGLSRVNLTTTVPPGSDATFNFTVTAPAAGSHSFQWRMVQQDVQWFGALSTNVNVLTVNNPPTVSLTSPVQNATFTAPATVSFAANAADSDGTITKVEFFQGSVKVGEDTTVPYTFGWTNVTAGSYVLTAKATDNSGATTVSSAVNITVNPPNQFPTVNVTAPFSGQIFTAPANIPITADANDTDGVVTKVQFYQGANLLGEDTSLPYTFNWNSVGAGNYNLTAKAIDNVGAITTSTIINIKVNTLPSVSFTGPANGQVFQAPANVTLTASASDTDGTIAKVEFYQGTTLLNEDPSPPYTFAWNNVNAGSYSLTAKAFDNSGGTATSGVVAITVNSQPTVSITGPANGSVYAAPANFTISASAADSDGSITKIEFYSNGTPIGEDPIFPYTFSYSNVSAGTYTLTAKATDNLNGVWTSTPVTVTVTNAPTTSITSPSNNQVFTPGSNITISASASDSDGAIAKVEFLKDGTVLGEDTSSPYSFAWNNVPSGNYSLTTRATDNLGIIGTSAPVNINVAAPTQLARLDPLNRTGGTGENPLSRNFAWSVPVLSLPGRAGLDLGLALSYNSLVWTKNFATSTITFDDDHGFPSPGFRLGFAVIQGPYLNSVMNRNAYLLITPSGNRIEFRQLNSATLFQSTDASYMILQVNTDGTLTVRTTDGTQLSYQQIGTDFQCTKIKDRNGNYISINYVSGRLDTIVDTLSRTIKFKYDAGGYPTFIEQEWNPGAVTHVWASFTYKPDLEIQTSFSGVTNLGPQDGAHLKVLDSVSLNNSTARFDFAYTSWGQVWKISQHTAGGNLLNYHSYDLPIDDTTVVSDCPRFTTRRDWAQSWNGDDDGAPVTAEEVVTSFSGIANAALPDNSLETVTKAKVTLPDGTYHDIYYAGTIQGTAGSAPAWQRGLPLVTDTFGRSDPGSSLIKQRSVVNTWTKDDPSVSYSLNPRVTETNVSDFNAIGAVQNRNRTRISYRDVTFTDGRSYSFPENVYEYAADLTTVLRRSYTDYNLDTTYTAIDRHIMGLIKEGSLYGLDPATATEKLMSKVTFGYDGSGAIMETVSPVQHDNAYNATFPGRGNQTTQTKHDTTTGSQAVVTSSMFYNSAGSTVKTIDFASRQTQIFYTDKFAANGITLDAARPSTLAYPTMVTNPDGYKTRLRYQYDLGVLTWRKTPQPSTTALNNNDTDPGPEQTFTYDSAGRIQRITTLTNGAYTRFVYPSTAAGSLNRIDTFRTILDGATELNGNEAHSLQVFDGHGRVIGSASSNPGTAGGFRGQHTIYDNLGRTFKTSNATETSAIGIPSGWEATGDDHDGGFLYVQQTYDWKGRPLVTTNPDNTTKVVSYEGCGCAGGEVITVTDEGTFYNLEVKKRQQKLYSDILGRNYKTEILNWDGSGPNGTGGTVYSTMINTFNARDQVTVTRVYQGPESASNPFQETLNAYDGYGRLSSQKKPEQLSASTFTYYDDDNVHITTDARGATATFTYNARQKILSVTYGGGFSAPAVTMEYDAAGNRTKMTDGIGTIDYNYDALSRLTSEARFITALSQTFTVSYGYNLADQMTTLTEPSQFGSTVTNVYDKAGQVTDVTGSNGGASQYASNIQYRAWGALKHLNYGNSLTLDLTYNSRLLATQYDLKTAGGARVMGQQYEYKDDGRVFKSTDLVNSSLNREYGYDNAGRLIYGITTQSGPYEQTYLYDVWGNMTFRGWRTWASNPFCNCTFPQFNTAFYNYSNNKNTAAGWSYDADGRLLTSREGTTNFTYSHDAAGRQITATQPNKNISESYDGDGQRAKWVENGATTYYIRSSALGGRVITELNQNGGKRRTYVYAGGEEIAKQEGAQVFWNHQDVSGVSMRTTNSSGAVTSKTETDPLGTAVDDTATYNSGGTSGYNFAPSGFYGNPTMPNMGCTLDGVMADCNHVQQLLNIGAAVQCPSGGCGPTGAYNPQTQRNELYLFNANAAAAGIGSVGVGRGFLPSGVNFVGNGFTVAPGAGAIFSGMGAMVDSGNSSTTAFISLNQIEILGRGGRDDSGGQFWHHGQGPTTPQKGSDPCNDFVQLPAGPPANALSLNDPYYTYEDPAWLNYARRGVVDTLTAFAANWHLLHPSYTLGIGDLGTNGGAGDFARHTGGGHAGGRIVDMRPMTKDSIWWAVTNGGFQAAVTSVGAATYSASLTMDLVSALFATGQVDHILFNDKAIQKAFPGKVTSAKGHSNHLHVVFKEDAGCP